MSEVEQDPQPVNDGRPWLAIFVNEDGTLKVTGHIHSKFVSYGLLESAKDSIRQHVDKQAQIERVNHSGGLMAALRNGRFGKH